MVFLKYSCNYIGGLDNRIFKSIIKTTAIKSLSQEVGIVSRFFCGVKAMILDEKVKKVVEEVIISRADVELVDLSIVNQGGNRLLKVLVDTKKVYS